METNEILKQLDDFTEDAINRLKQITTEADLNTWRLATLGKRSFVQEVFSQLAQASPQDRPLLGKGANRARKQLEAEMETKAAEIASAELTRKLGEEKLDVTLPGRKPVSGHLHPATQNMNDILAMLSEIGFEIYRSPEVETDENNFELLNIPAYHPARDMWDTFYTTEPGVLLRTHTSPGQIHAMRQFAPNPVRVALPGQPLLWLFPLPPRNRQAPLPRRCGGRAPRLYARWNRGRCRPRRGIRKPSARRKGPTAKRSSAA